MNRKTASRRSLRNPIWYFDLGSGFLLPAPAEEAQSDKAGGEERKGTGDGDCRYVRRHLNEQDIGRAEVHGGILNTYSGESEKVTTWASSQRE